jgi:F-type H+-transporting ATPase subunit epsilon
MAKLLAMDIVTPEKRVFEGMVKELTAPGSDGEFGVLPEHAPFATALVPGVVSIIKETGERELMAVSGGYIEVTGDKVVLLVETAEREGEIDVETIKRRKEEKEKLLSSMTKEDVDFDMLQASLLKEISMLKAVELLQKRKK